MLEQQREAEYHVWLPRLALWNRSRDRTDPVEKTLGRGRSNALGDDMDNGVDKSKDS